MLDLKDVYNVSDFNLFTKLIICKIPNLPLFSKLIIEFSWILIGSYNHIGMSMIPNMGGNSVPTPTHDFVCFFPTLNSFLSLLPISSQNFKALVYPESRVNLIWPEIPRLTLFTLFFHFFILFNLTYYTTYSNTKHTLRNDCFKFNIYYYK